MARVSTGIAAAWLAGCDGQPYTIGAFEPVRVPEGTFFEGSLPGDDAAVTPRITNAGAVGSIVTQGQSSIRYSGLSTPDTWSVAIGVPDVGTGYWMVPVGGPDTTQNNELVFSFDADFTDAVPYGLQTLALVAIGEQGQPGPRYETTVCVLPEAANNNLAACDPATPPQSAVISLTWDTQVDLDLIVVTPEGKVVRAKTPTTALVESGPVPTATINDPSTGRLSRDSNADCRIDGIRRESLVFPGEPPPGDYTVYANLSQACGRPSVHFQATLYRRVDAEDGTFPIEETRLASGTLLPLQADDSAELGLRLATVTLP